MNATQFSVSKFSRSETIKSRSETIKSFFHSLVYCQNKINNLI
jgi:hypothetical protein